MSRGAPVLVWATPTNAVGSIAWLGRDFHRSVKVNLPRSASWCHSAMAGARNRQTVFAKTSDMKFDRSLDAAQGAVDRFSRRNTPR